MERMVEVNTSELIGTALDWAVANYVTGLLLAIPCHPIDALAGYSPSTNWKHGGPLIEKYEIGVERLAAGWFAEVAGSGKDQYDDVPPLVVVCRAIVAANTGDVVSVPAGLCNVHPD